jgi:hypothetical protein
MELKELILSTLKELDEKIAEDGIRAEALLREQEERVEAEILSRIEAEGEAQEPKQDSPCKEESDEIVFLEHMKERLLVLFEGLQAEETKNIEAKLDITLNFLEYHLAKIEERLEENR